MAINSTISIHVTLDGDVQANIPVANQTNAASPGEHQAVVLALGDNTLTPPAGATAVLIVPPAGSTITKTLKGISGDTGLPISQTAPTLIPLATAPAAFILTTNGVETVNVYWL